jgi:hypothetical protein
VKGVVVTDTLPPEIELEPAANLKKSQTSSNSPDRGGLWDAQVYASR